MSRFFINNHKYLAQAGETILDVALRKGIDIPHLCKHPDLSVKANCRTCLVEIENVSLGFKTQANQIVTACSTQVEEGMKIKLDTPKVVRARKINLELIFSEHIEKCSQCLYQDNCTLLKYAKKYGLDICRFEDRKEHYPLWQFSDSIQFDASKCIDCRNCVEVCDKMQACDFYEITERGVETVVRPKGEINKQQAFETPPNPPLRKGRSRDRSRPVPTNLPLPESLSRTRCGREVGGGGSSSVDLLKNDPDKFDCTYCGQCVVHCPVGAISGLPHWQEVEKLLENREGKVLIAQIAPSIRVSIGEEFGEEPGKIMTGQLAASMKALGFDYAFDINLGADFTTYEEAQELIRWITENKPRPMFSSCCPAWVKFVEFYYPEFISHLTTANSPHMCSGPVIKTYFADYLKKDPRDLVVVSIMPCTAKKHEMGLETHQVETRHALSLQNAQDKGRDRSRPVPSMISAVDYILTTREYAYLLHKHKIDLPNLKPEDLDKPLDIYSGAGAIYGATGGVMESALRSADYFFRVLDETGSLETVLKGENCQLKKRRFSKIHQSRLEFKEVRGQQGMKSAQVKVGERTLRVAVANGLGNAKKILDDLQDGKVKYDYVEVMACPGGCIGGGGQPIPTNAAIRAKRAAALYEIDKNLPIRTAHENPSLLEVYQNYFKGDEELIEHLLHSGFKVREREGYGKISNFYPPAGGLISK